MKSYNVSDHNGIVYLIITREREGKVSRMSHHRAFTPKETPGRFPVVAYPIAVRKRARTKALKTVVKPILKSLRSLSLAAQIDVRPCFTFNSIGQKTAIRWRDAVDTAFSILAHCANDSARRFSTVSFGRDRPAVFPFVRTSSSVQEVKAAR